MESVKVIKENTDSMEVTKNSRGLNWVVKSYGNTAEEIEKKIRDLKARAEAICKVEQNE